MGDDSKPRNVLSLARGQDEMYKIIPIKGDTYTVNEEHILCLYVSQLPYIIRNNSYSVIYLKDLSIKSKSFKTRKLCEDD